MSEAAENREPPSVNKWMALGVLLLALLLLVGGVAAALVFANPGPVGPAYSLGDPKLGRQVVLKYGCVQCHTDDGSRTQGPSFKGLFGSTVTYIDGSSGLIDEADVRLALREPSAKVIATFDAGTMKAFPNMPDAEIVNLLAYLRSIGAK